MEIELIFIDDEQKMQDDAIVWSVEDRFGEENIKKFLTPEEGLSYIEGNLDKNLIIILDIDFPENSMNGHEALEKISKLSKLIPVILFSGINENDEAFSDFINNDAFGFVSKTATSEEMMYIIDKAVNHLENSLENAIEDWIINKEDDKDKPIYFTSSGKSFSLNQILKEIRNQSEIGLSFSQKLNKLTIDLLLRGKEKLDD